MVSFPRVQTLGASPAAIGEQVFETRRPIASHFRQRGTRASYFFKGNSKVLDLLASTFTIRVPND